MPIDAGKTGRKESRGRRLLKAVAETLLLLGALSCVTRGTYHAMVEERDALAMKSTMVEEELQSLQSNNEELFSKLSASEQELAQLRGTYDALVSDLKAELASGQVEIEHLRDGIRLNVSEQILFPSGSAQLDDKGRQVLAKVAAQVAKSPHRVEIEGHTDSVPISAALAARYPTNWELAGARAARVARVLQEEGIAGSQLRAVSHAEFDPAAPNDSDEGRQRNRRIGIRLIPAGSGDGADSLAAAPAP